MPRNRRRPEDDLAREDYRDPTAGFADAPPARCALTLRLILASFGLLACGLGAAASAVTIRHQQSAFDQQLSSNRGS